MQKAKIIDGKAIAATLREDLKSQVEKMPEQPGLAVLLVGNDSASQIYVRNKIKACETVGIKSFKSHLPEQATQEEVAAEIKAFNDNPKVHGILLQLPVPKHLDSRALIQMINPAKDVDGLTYINQGKLMAGDDSGLTPCTPQGALKLIQSVRSDLTGLHAVVIGRSLLFGKPMAQLLLAENCTVTTAHSRTHDLEHVCAQADILIAAVGQPEMVKANWIKPGAIVIDVGINHLPPLTSPPPAGGKQGGLCGDIDFEDAASTASALTPVPGGVGPMTIACLLANTVKAAKL